MSFQKLMNQPFQVTKIQMDRKTFDELINSPGRKIEWGRKKKRIKKSYNPKRSFVGAIALGVN